MQAVVRACVLWLWLLGLACAQNSASNGTNSTNNTQVGFVVTGADQNASVGGIANGLSNAGFAPKVRKSDEYWEVRSEHHHSAGNATKVNCTATPNATDCLDNGGGLSWWVIFLIVFFSIAGAAGLGWLIWYLYTRFGPRLHGYKVATGQDDCKIICVQLVAAMRPPEPS